MSRIVEGIKELWKGKDDDEPEYRRRYDERQAPGSDRYYGYPANGSPRGRSGYPTNGSAEGRGGYPTNRSVEGAGGYLANSIADPRSGYPVNITSEGRSGYLASTSPAEGVSGYRRPFKQALDDDYVRSSYDTRTESRGEYRKPAYDISGSSPRGSEFRKPYDVSESSPRGSEFRKPYGVSESSPRGSEFRKPAYDISESSPRGSEFRKPYGVSEASPRGSEFRRPYAASAEVSSRVEISPRGEYVRTPQQQSPREYRAPSGGSVIEFMVPMCCAKCKEKVQEELMEVDGVRTVRCDPPNSRVIVTGDQYIDIDKCLTKSERAVKNKCELISNRADDGSSRREKTSSSGYYEAVERSGILTPPPASRPSLRGPIPSPTGGRPTLGRLPSFASGKVTQYDGVGPRGQDYEAKDYNGFRRMPSFSKHRHHEAEYITSFDQRPEPSDSREFAPIRRMPSFNRHRHHDAEYITADDSPRTFYDASNASYPSPYNTRSFLQPQISFSKIPVENPNYVKSVACSPY